MRDVFTHLNVLPETFHVTSFSLCFKERRLCELDTLENIDGLNDNTQIFAVPEKYTYSSSVFHLSRVLSILELPSLYLRNRLVGDQRCALSVFEKFSEDAIDSNLRIHDCFDREFYELNAKRIYPERVIHSLNGLDACVKYIRPSDFNPPSGERALYGDLFYLDILTLEGRYLTVTAHEDGFFVNSCTSVKSPYEGEFNPEPHPTISAAEHNLIDLLKSSSPEFSKRYKKLVHFYTTEQSHESCLIPFSKREWCIPHLPHLPSYSRSLFFKPVLTKETMAHNCVLVGGAEQLIESQMGRIGWFGLNGSSLPMRDWNEEWQMCRNMPKTDFNEMIKRDRARHQCYCDFAEATVRAVAGAVDGSVSPLETGNEQNSVFLYDNIFLNGMTAPRVIANEQGNASELSSFKVVSGDLHGVKSIDAAGVDGLNCVASTLVDYKGQRFVCQSVINGILSMDQSTSVVYGSDGRGSILDDHEEFKKILRPLEDKLHIKKSLVKNGSSQEKNISLNVNTKGIIGWDINGIMLLIWTPTLLLISTS